VVLAGDPCVSDPLEAILEQPAHSTAAVGGPAVTGHQTAALRRHAEAFFQGNRYLLPSLTRRVTANVGEGPVMDLYAGVGLFACALAARDHDRIVAVEGERVAAEDLVVNAAQFGRAVQVQRTSVEDYLQGCRQTDAGTVILDPPRTGVSTAAMSGLLTHRPARIVYASCDAPTLARDTRRLLDADYVLDEVEAFDLFPNTAHIETLATFSLHGR
jgi:23S rRNA (uracil1939-C5)-methyltransferase